MNSAEVTYEEKITKIQLFKELVVDKNLLKFISEIENQPEILKNEACPIRECQFHAYSNVKNRLKERRIFGANVSKEMIIQMATGTGKTGLICLLATALENVRTVLVLTHSVLIRSQIKKSLGTTSTKGSFWYKVGLTPPDYDLFEVTSGEIPTSFQSHKSIILASIQSLTKQTKKLRKNAFDLVIFDEGHKKGAEIWDSVVNAMDCPILLVTATPFRSDGNKLFDKPIYSYTFNDALESDPPILKTINFKTKDDKNYISDMTNELVHVRNKYDLSKSHPKIIFRAGSFDSVKKHLVLFKNDATVKQLGLSVVAVHTGFSISNHPEYKDKNSVPDDYDIIIHQDMLIEGFDDPPLCILGFEKRIDDSRVLIQLIGRVVRHDSKQVNLTNQQATIYAPDKEFHENNWKLYIKFEQNPDLYYFHKMQFIPKTGSLSDDVLSSILIKPSILIRKHTRLLSTSKISELHNDIHDWFQSKEGSSICLIDKFERPKSLGKSTKFTIFLYQKSTSPVFLSNVGITNSKWHILILVFIGRYIFIQATDSTLPKPIQNLKHCSENEFDKLLPDSKFHISSLRLDNILQGDHILKSKSLTSTKAENHILLTKDSSFNAKTITWYKPNESKSETSATISTKRLTHHKKLRLYELISVCRGIEKELSKTAEAKLHPVFKSLAKVVTPSSKNPFYFNSVFDSEVTFISGKTTWNSFMAETQLDKNGRGNLIFHNNTNIGKHSIKIERKDDNFIFDWASKKAILMDLGNGEQIDLKNYLNKSRSFTLTFEDGKFYSNGRFYKIREISESDILRKYIEKDDTFNVRNCKIEMGGTANDLIWRKDSIFSHIENYLLQSSDDLALICDDDKDEWADYLYFNFTKKKIAFIHAKHSGKKKLRVDSLYTVLGQASKTAHHLWEVPNTQRLTRWRESHPKRKNISRLRTKAPLPQKKIKELFLDSATSREVWVIQPSIDIAKLSNQKEMNNRIYTLLCHTINACISNNAKFRFFGSST